MVGPPRYKVASSLYLSNIDLIFATKFELNSDSVSFNSLTLLLITINLS